MNFLSNYFPKSILWLLLISCSYVTYAQVSVTGAASGNTNYTTLRNAFIAINSASQSNANIVVTITGDTDESTLAAVLNAGTWTTLLIKPSGNRTITGATASGSSLISLNGADNVTIDGLNNGTNSLIISNTSTSATIGTSTILFVNDATNNIVRNCTIAGSETGTASGTIYFSSTTGTTGNIGNSITNNTVTSAGSNLPANAIYSYGTVSKGNDSNTISNNNIQDFFNTSANSNGIFLAANSATWTISGNKLYQTATRTITNGSTYRGIYIGTIQGNYIITNNTIGFANTSGTGTTLYNGTGASLFRGIDINITSASIQGNVIAGINFTSTATLTYAPGIFVGIYVNGAATIGTTTGNTIGNAGVTNSIVVTATTALTTATRFSGIYVTTASASSTVQNNTIAGISTGGLDTNGYSFIGINTVGTSGNFTVDNNTIGNASVTNSIALGLSGITASGVCTFYGIVNSATGTSSITNNKVLNCSSFGTAGSSFSGIENTGSSIAIIDYNTLDSNRLTGTGAFRGFYNGASASTLSISNNTLKNYNLDSATSAFYGIQNAAAVTSTITINNNKLGDTIGGLINYSVASSALMYGIYNSSGTSATTLLIQGNDFRGITYAITSSGSENYIINGFATLSQDISNNTFTNLNIASSGNVTFISNNVALPVSGSQTISNNAIVGTFNKSVAGGTVLGFTASSASIDGTTIVNNGNNFSNITVTGATSLTGWNQKDTGSTNKTISNNTFNNWSGGTNSLIVLSIEGFGNGSTVSNNTISLITAQTTIIGLNIGTTGNSSNLTVSNNTITNLSSTGTGGSVYGIQCNTNIPTLAINSNTINILSSTGISSAVYGIQVSGGTGTVSIYSNVINGLSESGTSAPGVNGVYVSAGTMVYMYKNKVYDLSLTSSTTGGTVSGLSISGGTGVTAYNNIFGDYKAPLNNNSNVIRAINITSSTANSTYELDNNTIYLNATSTGTNFGTSGINHSINATSTTSNLILKNNLVINNSTANGTGITAAYYRSGTEMANYNSASNNNLFYAGTPSNSNLVFYNGTRYQTLLAYQTFASPRDSATKTENTASLFQSTTGSNANYLRIPSGTNSQAESGAMSITTPLINTDYWNVTRPFVTPVNGGTASDIGASEFDGIPANCITPVGQPTSFTIGSNTSTSVAGSFLTASGTPTGYLVVMSSGTLTFNPIDGTTYTTGSSLGNGTIIQASNSLNFTATSLTPNTTYTFTIFSYNIGICSPSITKYLITSPLVGSLITCSAAPTGNANQSFCGTKTLADIVAVGISIKYYATASLGSSILSTTAITYGNTYYLTQTVGGCESKNRLAVTVTSTTTAGDQVTYGAGSWIGYVYSPISVGNPPADAFTSTYQGYITQTEQFNQIYATNTYMSGTYLCGSYTANYSIRFKMNKTFAPDYYKITTGGDDGYRFSIDGGLNYTSTLSNWTTHSYTTTTSAVYLSGSTNLVFDYYQNPANSQVSFSYTACNSSTAPTSISGTTLICNGSSTTLTAVGGTLASGAVYEWGTGSVVGSNIIAGQTSASIIVSPSTTTTYWVIRVDGAPCNLSTTGITQVVTVTLGGATVGGTVASDQTICSGTTPADLVLSGNNGNVNKWQKATDAAFTNPIDIVSTTSTLTSATISPLSTTTYFRAVVQNGGCNVVNSAYVTITVNTSVGGNVASNQSICTGTQPSNLTLTGNTGTVTKWQKATDAAFTTPIDIANPSTTLTGATIGSLTTTTYFRAVVQNGSCATANSAYVTITVNATTVGGTVASNQSICTGTAPADLVLSGNNGNVIEWEKATDTAFTTPIDIASTSTTLTGATIGILTTTTYFRAVVQNGSCATANSAYVTISVNDSVGGNVSSDQTICSGSTPSTLTASGYTGTILKWQKSTDVSFTSPTDIADVTPSLSAGTIGALTTTTYFRAIVQYGNCSSINSAYATITVNTASVGGAVNSNQTICTATSPTDLTLTGNTGNVVKWQKSTDSSFTSPIDISNTGTILASATIGTLTATTYFRAVVQNGVCAAANSVYCTITITPASIGGTVSSDQTICVGTASSLTLTGNTGSVIEWEKSTDATFTSPTDIVNTTNTLSSAIIGTLTGTTYFRAVVQNGSCTLTNSAYATITVTPPPGDEISYGTDSWIGYVYTPFATVTNPPTDVFSSIYRGYLTQSETFNYDLTNSIPVSGATICGSFLDYYGIRYKMQKSFTPGYYNIVVGGDDGFRLSLDGGATWGINKWQDQSYTSSNNTFYLSGATNLVLEYYERTGYSRLSYSYTPCLLSTAPTSITGTTSICSGSSTTLSATGANLQIGAVYQWGTGLTVGSNIISGQTASTYTVNPSSTTSYWVRVIDAAPCSIISSGVISTVTVSTASTNPSSITGTSTICYGSSTTLTATGGTEAIGATYQWGTTATIGTNIIAGQTASSITINPNITTTYWVRRIDTAPCNTITSGKTQIVTVNTFSTAPTSISGSTSLCNGSSVTLSASGGIAGTGATYQWGTGTTVGSNIISGQTASTYIVKPLITTTYWVRRLDPSPCNTTTSEATTTITVTNPSTAPTAISGTTTICSGTSTTLTATGGTGIVGSVYQWGTGTTIGSNIISGQTGQSITVTPYFTTTYWVRRYDGGTPCGYTSGVSVVVNMMTVTGDSSAFGDNVWNVYGYNGADITLATAIYAGYYSVNTLGDNTLTGTNSWANTTSPSASAGWSGCLVNVDHFTMVHKRKGFPCGTYSLTLSSWDDATQVYINGTLAWSCAVWYGANSCNGKIGTYTLDGNSTIEIRVREDAGVSSVNLSLTDLGTFKTSTSPLSIIGSTNICSGSSTTLTATGGTLGTSGVYEWGTGTTVGSNIILGQVGASIVVAPSSSTTYWVRRVDGRCNTTAGISQLVTVAPASVGGTLTSNQTICSGTLPTDLILSDYTGNVLKWQKSPNSGFTSTIDIATTSATLSGATIGSLNSTTYFRAVVLSGTCASSVSNIVTITVIPATVGGTVTSNQTICSGTFPSDLTLTGNTGNVLKWQKATDASFTSPIDISITGTTLTSSTIGVLTVTTYFRAVVQSDMCSIVNSSYVAVSINDNSVGGVISSDQTICSGTSPSDLSLTGNIGSIIKWQKATNSSFTSATDITNTSNILTSAIIGNLSSTTYFRAVVQNGSCATAYSNFATVTVNTSSTGGSINSNQTIGYGTQPSNLTLSGNTGSVLKWQKASNSTFTSSTDIASTSNILLGSAIGNLTSTTYFRAEVQGGTCLSAYSNYAIVNVNPASVGGIISNNQSICTGTSPMALTLSNYTGVIQRWESSNDITFSSPTVINNTSTILNGLSALSSTTYYRAVVKNGSSPEEYSSYVTITVNPMTVGGNVSSNQTICSNSQPNAITLTNYTGSIIKWQKATDATFTTLTDMFSSTSAVLTGENIGPLTATTYIRAVVQSGSCSAESSTYTSIIVNSASVSGIVSSDQTICKESIPSDLSLSGNTGAVLKWQYDSLSDFSTAVDVSNTTTLLSGATIGSLSATTYFRAVVQNGACPNSNSASASITVINSSIGGVVSTSQSICSGTSPSDLTLSGYLGNIIKWQKANDESFTFPIDIASTSTTLTGGVIGNLLSTTYFRAVVQNGNCSEVYSSYVTITINAISIGGSVSSDMTLCSGDQPSDLTLSGHTGSIMKWQKANNSDFTSPLDISDTDSTLTGTAIGSLTSTTYFRAVVQNGSCSIANSNYVMLTILDSALGGTISSDQAICSGMSPADLTLSGNRGSIIKWQSAVDSSFSAPLDILNTSNTLLGTTIGNLSSTTYFRAVVQNGSCSIVYSNYATININYSIGGTVSGSSSLCAGNQATDLTLTGQTGSIIKWQQSSDIDFTSPTDLISTSTTLSGTTIGDINTTSFFRAVVQNATCGTVYSSIASIIITATTWDGTAWNNGEPNETKTAIMNGNYSSAGNLNMCSLTVANGAKVVVNPGNNFLVTRKVIVDTNSSLTIESNANLVQIDNVINSGNIIVKRDTSPLKRLDYVLWSSPVVDQNLYAFSPLTSVSPTRFYSYNPDIDVYDPINTPENYTFTLGKGYLIRMPNTFPSTPIIFHGQFVGVPNNGNYGFAVSSGKYNAIGNPYPSTINADDFIDVNQIQEALYFWRKTNNPLASSYATYTKAGGTANLEYLLLNPITINNRFGIQPNGIIQVGQGFIVRAPSSNIVFNNSMRISNNNNQFLRTNIEKHRIWLNLASTSIANQMLVAYMTGASQGVDPGIDGKYMNDCQTALNSYLNNTEYIIQGRSLPFDSSDVVPLTFKTTTAENFTIAIDHVDGLFSGNQDIFLKDNFTNSIHDLKLSPYTFASEIGTFNNRFELVYSNSTLDTQNPTLNENSVVVYKKNDILSINAGNIIIKNIKIFDVRGRLIYYKNNVNAKSIDINYLGIAKEVIIVKIISDDDKVVAKKVLY